MRPTAATLATLTALTLTGCSSDTDLSPEQTSSSALPDATSPTATEEPTTIQGTSPETYSTAAGHDPYGWSDGYALGQITFHTDPDPIFAQYTAGTGWTEKYVYAAVDVDNREGLEPIGPNGLALYTEAGEKIECRLPNGIVVDEIQPNVDESMEMNELAWELYPEDIAVGERRTVTYVCPANLPDEVTSVTIRPYGTDELPAYPEQV